MGNKSSNHYEFFEWASGDDGVNCRHHNLRDCNYELRGWWNGKEGFLGWSRNFALGWCHNDTSDRVWYDRWSHLLMSADTQVIPLYQALSEPFLLAGVPRNAAFSIWISSMALAGGMQQWLIGIALGIALHTLAAKLAKIDPCILDVALRQIKYPTYFDS